MRLNPGKKVMTLTIIILILLAGLAFLFVELFLFPGLTFLGVTGAIVMVLAVYLTYAYHGTSTGNIVLGLTVLANAITLVYGYKKLTASNWRVTKNIDSKVNEVDITEVEVGEKGITQSALRPNGKAIIRNNRLEVFSVGDFIDPHTEIQVHKIEGNKIWVKTLKA